MSKKFFYEDYEKGKEKEEENFNFFKDYFNEPNLKHNKEIFSTFDFSSEKILIEMKQRNCDINTYNDLMIGYNKIEKCKKTTNKDIYFIMSLNDGLYCYKYNKNDELKIRNGGRCDRKINEFKKYYFIPTNLFIKIK